MWMNRIRRCVAHLTLYTVTLALTQGPAVAADGDPASVDVGNIKSFAEEHLPHTNERVEIEVGKLDPRLHLKPCDHLEPFLAPGARLWGRSHIGHALR